MVDEFSINLAPIMMRSGVRLFKNINKEKFSVELNEVVSSQMVTHLFYKGKIKVDRRKILSEEKSRFAERKIIQINALAINRGSGGIHCGIQDQPKIKKQNEFTQFWSSI